MDRDGQPGSLALINSQVLTAAARLAELTRGVDHPYLDTARRRLRWAGQAIPRAVGGPTWPAYIRARLLGVALLGVTSWAAAAVAGQLIGLSGGWTIAVTVAVAAVLHAAMGMLNVVLEERATRRRAIPAAASPIVSSAGETSPEEIVMLLAMARDGLTVAMRRRLAAHKFGHLAQTAVGFDWLRCRSPRLYWMSVADRQVCQAIYFIQLWQPSNEAPR